ncbi:hypothetical protein L211DRAFT_786854 [Terfezia boudieri ATCC MYA-4762]|uniref:Mitochondrial zinc maintenance protein 1, mitochondrial n=1 Tax=Terfezia boudieri ATCC MYA-4762 TaxID=1051890 RepID=A0A3N4LKS9_9PEZI|nr:hypothetical protein L211DRAFT_786854 [Terfezia boudieri ATCC MYA-4762]
MALPAYRHLLRAIRTAFQGDTPLLNAARAQSRSAFLSSRTLAPDSPEARERITYARDVARVLRENVVQGQKEGATKEGQVEVYRLRIHPEIERGDNDTIKNPETGITSPRVKCCSEK